MTSTDSRRNLARLRRIVAGGAAVAVATVLPVTEADAANLTPVPYPIDSSNQAGWWTPLETYVGGSEYAYLAFNEPGSTEGTHRVAVARRDGSGNWSRLPVMNGTSQAEFADDIGHNQPSIARDGSGYLHVFASMHNNSWRYFRSDTVGGAPQFHAADLPDRGPGVTYPVVATAPNGDVYVAARVDDGNGTSRSGRLYRWDNAARTWSRVAIFAQGANRSLYPDDLQIDAAGNVHLLFEWSAYPSSGFRHQLSYLKYLPATGAFQTATGAAATVPVTPASADVVQPLESGEGYVDTGPAVQSAKLTLDGASPKVAYRYRSPASGEIFEVRYAWVTGGAWAREVVHSGTQTSAAIDITWHPTEQKRIYFTLTAGTDRARLATKPATAWVEASVAPGVPIDRLAVERNANGVDVLYLVDLTNRRLYYGRN